MSEKKDKCVVCRLADWPCKEPGHAESTAFACGVLAGMNRWDMLLCPSHAEALLWRIEAIEGPMQSIADGLRKVGVLMHTGVPDYLTEALIDWRNASISCEPEAWSRAAGEAWIRVNRACLQWRLDTKPVLSAGSN